jgi:hypothetical protein
MIPLIIDRDPSQRRDGTCKLCQRSATVFPARLDNGSWTSVCDACAGDAKEMP